MLKQREGTVLEMRGKLVVWSYLLVLSFATILNLYMPKTEAAQKESIVIPGEAIRLRILANSDFEKDQAIKRKVRDAVNAQITLWVQDLTSMEKAREVLNAKLPEIQSIAEKVVLEQGSDQSVKVEFGEVQFPTKLYGQFLYPAGKYQAILITLGKGEGANWWCVLYPPLCFLDFSNGVAVSEGFEEKKGYKKGDVKVAKAQTQQDEEISERQPQSVATEEIEKQDQLEASEKTTEQRQPEAAEKTEKQQVEKKTVKKEATKKPNQKKAKSPIKSDAKTAHDIKKQKALFEEETVAADDIETIVPMEKKKPVKKAAKQDPVYVAEDEQPVEVKFFVVEMWDKMFN
jgi:stage II sporulation protein R